MKLTKRMLSLLLTVVMVLSMIPAVYAAGEAATEETWTPNPTQTYTADEWFEVGTAEELQSLMSNKLLNDPKCLNVEANEGKTFGIRLTADISTNTTKAANHYAVMYAGHYVEATDTEPAYGFAVNYVIDLNGHTITDTSYNYRMIGVYNGSDIVLTNGTVRAEGKYVSTGGVFFTQDNTNLTFDGVQIIANSGCKNGTEINGNIANFRDKLIVKNSRIEVYETVYTSGTEINRAQYGGMFWVAGATATVTLENSEFVGGYAKDGGMFQVGYTTNFTATDCTFTGGTATNNAGMINSTATNGSIKLTRCTFTGGEAGALGGQIRMAAAAPLSATDCTFTGGTAVSGGGNITIGNANSKTTTPVHNFIRCTISDGTATNGSGGNIYIKNSASTHRPETVTFKDCTVSGGEAQGSEKFGGNIYGCSLSSTQSSVTYYPVVTFDGGSVSGGQAVYGGNFGSANYNQWVFTGGVEVSGGIATKKGGNLYSGNKNTVTTIYDATFTGGEAGTSGGNVQPNAGKFYMYGGTITGGTAPSGKVFYATSSTLAAEIYGGTLSHTSSSSCYSGSSYIKIFNATTIGFGMTSCVVEGHSSYTKLEGTPTTYIYTHDDLDGDANNTAATCTTDGQIKVECADCDMTFTYAVPATGHTPGEEKTENEVANSCTADGSYDTVVYCTVCNAEISRETNTVSAAGHTPKAPVVENEVANSCTADGSYDTVVYCAVCNAEISRETNTVSATGHTPKAPVVENEVANSCTADGSYDTVVYCEVCNAELSRETNTVSATGHTEETIPGKDATCTETGLTEGKKCTVCGTVTVAQNEIPAIGHKYDEVKTDATFESDAFTTYTCSVCGYSYVETHEGTKLTAVATADGVPFETLQEALTAGGAVVLLQDVADSDALEVKNTVVLDLNGKTVSMNDASGKAAQLITNSGNLTIMDSVGSGKLTFHSTTPSASNSYSTSTIINVGTLKIVGGTIENTTTSGPSYAIDNAWYTTDVSLSVEGGVVTAVKPAIRQVPFSTTAKNTITISGGEISGYAGLQIHNYQKTACLSDVTITGGTFTGSYAFYTSYSYNNTAAGTNIAIDGGVFNGYVYLYNGNAGSSEYPMAVSVTGGTFNTGYYCYVLDANGAEVSVPSVTGGTHIYDVTDYCVEGYGMHDNGDGTYGIHQHTYTGEYTDATTEADAFTTHTCSVCGHSYVETHEGTMIVTGATVNGTHYATLAEALENAEAGATVKLLESAAMDTLQLTPGVALDLNGQTLTADLVVAAFASTQIIDTTNGKGLLLVDRDSLVISETNAQLPLWDDAENGYRFVEVSLRQSAVINEAGNGYLRFYIEGEDANCVLQQALSDGGADNGVYIQVKLSWKDVNGSVAGRTFVYSEELVAQYAENWTGNEFRLTVTGMKNVTELNLTATVVYKIDAAEEKPTVSVAGETETLTK